MKSDRRRPGVERSDDDGDEAGATSTGEQARPRS